MRLNEKENFLKVMHHEVPESIPVGLMGFKNIAGERPYAIVGPSPLDETHLIPMDTHIDAFGLKWITNAESNGGLIPDVSHLMLDDVTKWRDVIKTPDISGVDWEKQAKEDIERSGIDRSKEACMVTIGLMPYQEFAGFMGFVGALCAMFEEPEEVKALMDWMADQYMPVIEASIKYYQPDAAYLLDDTAARYQPFFSVDMYEDIMLPVYTKLCKPYVDAGIPIEYHNCGRCEDFFDMALQWGADLTDPVQVENDVPALKAKYGRRLALCGGIQFTAPDTVPEFNEDEMREQIHSQIDVVAKDGGYLCGGGGIVNTTGRDISELQKFVSKETYNYCQDYYKTH